MTHYDAWASHYDSLMGNRDDVIEILQSAIDRYHPDAKTVLELGCGTGTILGGLNGKYSLTGLDLSMEMLKIAQQKLAKSRLICGDIIDFELDTKFDIIFCVFDTINHLRSYAKWEKVFLQAKKHLRASGLFIFDMDTLGRMEALGKDNSFIQEIDNGSAELDITSLAPGQVKWNITIQQHQSSGVVQVYEDEVIEVSFPLAQVIQSVSEHFDIIETFDSLIQAPSEKSDRVYFVCRLRDMAP